MGVYDYKWNSPLKVYKVGKNGGSMNIITFFKDKKLIARVGNAYS